jgi:3',5'-cyclic AMP phosphodiesterase CpdA
LKIAHISDFHLRHHLPGDSAIEQRKSRQMPNKIALAVKHIQTLSPDLIAVTGDLVDYPLDQMDVSETVAQGKKDLQLIQELFAPFSCPIAFLFGNHDHPTSFDRIFTHLSPDFDVQGHRVVSFFDHEGPNHIPQRVGDQHTRFRALLKDSDPRLQIHLQHYLITPEHNQDYPHTYANGQQLTSALLNDPRPKLCLSGHYHKGENLFQQDHVYFAIARAFCEPPHPYRIYTIDANAITQTEYTLLPE